MGRNGIRSAVQLAPSAYLASAAGCAGLVSSILPPQLRDTPNPWPSRAEALWSQSHIQAPLPPRTVIASGHGTLQELKANSIAY